MRKILVVVTAALLSFGLLGIHATQSQPRAAATAAVTVFASGLEGPRGLKWGPDGNLYVAEVDSGRFQKFRPRAGANPATLIGKPIYSAWQ